MADKVKVAVRVRPFNRREMALGTKCVVDMEGKQTILYHPSTGVKESTEQQHSTSKKAPKSFAYDHCFWSIDDSNPKNADQEKVFNCLGKDILQRAFEGYNACIFAYGQTGSGKSYTMMGTQEQKGIIPRLCDALFDHISGNPDPDTSFKIEVSYMEIYNEKVRDLLDPKGGKHSLKVREHNILGPYVDGLSTLAVSSFEDIDALMVEGNKSRTVAATNMNSESSRSHAVFNIIVTQILVDQQSGVSGEKVSKMSLVDLAGSERAQKTGAVGERLKEGSNINKSLTTLSLVISALADQACGKSKTKFVPYRDSVLTWLLKDNLGGNSKTVMVATLSPSADNYEETLSTLRYADRAKRIVNHAVVNEDPNARIIRELREEVEALRQMLNEAQNRSAPDLLDRLQESERLMNDMSKTWEEKLKDTERIHQERHAALEKMGISVQTSGIKVEQGKYYLVNLNADPSLNELLVYYLKEHTLVGRPQAPTEQDIQLSGLGIMHEHCICHIENSDVFIEPLEGARTCVNGCQISTKTKVKHGDRILWGNNHFFRINCPKANSPSAETPEQNIDYDFAQAELMMQEMGDDPIQDAISAIEKQHEEDKAEALERQRQMYERQMQMLRSQLMSPSTPSQPYPPFFDPFNKLTPTGTSNANMHPKYQQWAQEREKLFKQSLAKLKGEVVKANTLVREANFLAQEMAKQTEFFVTLQIPAANLSPNRKRGAFVSEPAILVRRKGKGSQIWSMDKFENKIIDMRDMYQERKEKGLPMMVDEDEPYILTIGDNGEISSTENPSFEGTEYFDYLCDDEGPPAKGDPFYESQENHNLIGVANVFLESLFYDVKLDYHVPIISQQGEVAGRLHIELSRVAGSLPHGNSRESDLESEGSLDSGRASGFEPTEGEGGIAIGSNLVCRVCIKEARGLPPALSNFVFCQYTFWNYPEPIVVPPVVDPDIAGLQRKRSDGMSFKFDHKKEFVVHITEEFMEHCAEGALSMEVWGHRSIGFSANLAAWELDQVQAKSRSIMDRWSELTRKIELYTEIHELNEQGEYMPVEVMPKPEVLTGGIYQLRQGHSRRIQVQVKPVQNSGTLPIICESIQHVSIGCVCARSKLQKGLDSYQEEDLGSLREKWSDALSKRRDYLDEQLQKIMNKDEKTDTDIEREKSLVDQWVCLTEERNAVLVPAAGSGIPGAPADWSPPPGMEEHIPVIFLDLNADDMSTPNVKEGMQASGINSILPKEHGTKSYTLPFVKNSEKDVCALCSWDSSIHDSVHLNRVTPNNERVYLILKTVVRLSHPASMELVLRKRLCINVYKRQSITDKLKKKIGKSVVTTFYGGEYFQDTLFHTGVTYEVVSNIPKASEDLEDRESLAQMAASSNETHTSDGETYIEKYIKGVSAVESILTLDRLRQEVAIKELLAARGRPLRKATSVPNINNILASPRGLDEQIRADSIHDLSYNHDDRYSTMPKQFTFDAAFRHRTGSAEIPCKDSAILPNKPTGPFNLARPTFLNLRTNTYSSVAKRPFTLSALVSAASPKSSVSPQPTKLVKPMKTLVEEQHIRETKPLLRTDTEDSKTEPSEEKQSDEDEFAKLKDQSIATMKTDAQNDSGESDDFQDFESYQGQQEEESNFPPEESMLNTPPKSTGAVRPDSLVHSNTSESLEDAQVAKTFTPSMASSGYGSQALSTQTLSSDDSASVKSISIDDTPETDCKKTDSLKANGVEKSDEKDDEIDKDTAEKDEVPGEVEGEVDANKLVRELSLIDSEVPDNLGTPLQPTSPLDGEFAEGELEIKPEETEEASASAIAEGATFTVDEPALQPETEEPEIAKTLTDSDKECRTDSASSEEEEKAGKLVEGGKKEKDGIVDMYSETAMEELEALGDEESGPSNPQVVPGAAAAEETSAVEDLNEAIGAAEMPVKSDPASSDIMVDSLEEGGKSEEAQESVDTFEEVPRRRNGGLSDEKAMRRKSWHEKSDRRSIDDTPVKQEVKLRKSASMDVSRANLKKLRTVEGKSGKTAPSPVKATYRPVSMPIEMVDSLEENGEQSRLAEDNDSDNEDTMSICSFGSRADLHRLGEAPIPSWIQMGEPVVVLSSQGGSKLGTVTFIGQTEFAGGNWVGVELDTPDGKNDGSVKGVRYFKCRQRHGIFVRHDKLIMDKKRKGKKMKNVPPPLRRSTGNLSSPSPQKESLPSPSGSKSFMKGTTASASKKK